MHLTESDLNPRAALAFSEEIGRLADLLTQRIDAVHGELTAKKVAGEPVARIAAMNEAALSITRKAAEAAALFRHHVDVQDHIEAIPHVGGDAYLTTASGGPAKAHIEDQADEADEDAPAAREVYTTCECGELLATPTTDEAAAWCPDCDPDLPPTYRMGTLTKAGKLAADAEGYRRLVDAAIEAGVLIEWETPRGEVAVSLPDGSMVDVHDWVARPEVRALAGFDQYAGRGEYDPAAPSRCWIGQTLPSGRMARPMSRAFEDVADLAAHVCKEVFEGRGMDARPCTVMLPGGELVDAEDWAQLPETRRLAGCTHVRNRVTVTAAAPCSTCGAALSATRTELVHGHVGEVCRTAVALYCAACDAYLPPAFVPVALVDDASATTTGTPRLIAPAHD